MIFAREINANLTSLVKKLDAEVAKNKGMGAFVVLLTTDEAKAEKALKELKEKEGIKNVSLTTDSEAGPPKYKVSKDAEVTAVLYSKQEVKANYSFAKGGLDAKGIDAFLADLPKITGK